MICPAETRAIFAIGGDTAEVTLAELREQRDVSKEVCPLLRLGRPQVQVCGPGFGKRLVEDTPADLRVVPALADFRGLVKRILGRTHKPLLSRKGPGLVASTDRRRSRAWVCRHDLAHAIVRGQRPLETTCP